MVGSTDECRKVGVSDVLMLHHTESLIGPNIALCKASFNCIENTVYLGLIGYQ